MSTSARQKIRDFILANYLFTDDAAALCDDESLTQRGIIDSTGILEVISFLEQAFGVKVRDGEMVPENFDRVDNLVSFLERKQAERVN